MIRVWHQKVESGDKRIKEAYLTGFADLRMYDAVAVINTNHLYSAWGKTQGVLWYNDDDVSSSDVYLRNALPGDIFETCLNGKLWMIGPAYDWIEIVWHEDTCESCGTGGGLMYGVFEDQNLAHCALCGDIVEVKFIAEPPEEEYTPEETRKAIEAFLEYGEQTYKTGHQGYFSGTGWAARCLRWYLETMEVE